MRRDLKVNADQDSADAPEAAAEFENFVWGGGDESLGNVALPHTGSSAGNRYGTCLYFGPAGERCDRPAGESGFCREHAQNHEGKPSLQPGKIIGAIAAILALLWPVMADVVQFILRWIRQHHGL